MANCVYGDVQEYLPCGNLSSTAITNMITLSDAEITRRGVTGTASDLKDLSLMLTAERVAARLIQDPTIGVRTLPQGPEYYRDMAERIITQLSTTEGESSIPFVAHTESDEGYDE